MTCSFIPQVNKTAKQHVEQMVERLGSPKSTNYGERVLYHTSLPPALNHLMSFSLPGDGVWRDAPGSYALILVGKSGRTVYILVDDDGCIAFCHHQGKDDGAYDQFLPPTEALAAWPARYAPQLRAVVEQALGLERPTRRMVLQHSPDEFHAM